MKDRVFSFLKSALLLISLIIPGIVADESNVGDSNSSYAGDANVAKHGCPSTCGNLTVPYPFGIGLGSSCSISPLYDIICDESSDPPQAFLSSGVGNILVIGINETTIHIKNQPASICYDHNKAIAKKGFGISILGTPFSFSNENKLTAVGCDDAAFILRSPDDNVLDSGENEFISSCVAICSKHEDLSNGFCSGIGCCQASIPKGVQSIYSFMWNLNEGSKNHNQSYCSYSFLAEQNSYTFNISDISDPSFFNRVTQSVPIVLDWVIGNQTCNQTGELLCQRNSECVDSGSTLGGYHCNCSQGYQGNPYLSPGCCWTLTADQIGFVAEGANITKPGCMSKCGNLSVPYPFGIGINSSCSINPFFAINCDTSSNPPKAFLSTYSLEVLGISETKINIKNNPGVWCYDQYVGKFPVVVSGVNLLNSPFSISNENKLTVVGCDDSATLLTTGNEHEGLDPISSCSAICSRPGELTNDFCSGIGCCQSSIPEGAQLALISLSSRGHRNVQNFSFCGYSFLAEQRSYSFDVFDISNPEFASKITETVPIVIDWAIGNHTCNQIGNTSEFICHQNSVCVDSGSGLGGYHCKCSQGYHGNPYLSPGRTVKDNHAQLLSRLFVILLQAYPNLCA